MDDLKYICPNCHNKLFDVQRKACDEISKRLDNGETLADLVAEYENEKRSLLKGEEQGYSEERFLYLDAAIASCSEMLAAQMLFNSGWAMNHSGLWVKKPAPDAKEAEATAETQEPPKTEVPGDMVALLQSTIETLHKQLEVKDQQIADLTAANKELAQSINADRRNDLAGTMQEKSSEPSKKVYWWQRKKG